MDKNGFQKRYDILVKFAQFANGKLKRFLAQAPERRNWGMKHDNTPVSDDEYGICDKLYALVGKNFPDDSRNIEEKPLIKISEEWEWLLDPFDGTWDAIRYRQGDPRKQWVDADGTRRWPAVMVSLAYMGRPVAFGLGLPLHDEIFWGSVFHGISRNGKPYDPPFMESELVIELPFSKEISKITGREGYLAAPCSRLILTRAVGGGIHPDDRPYESQNMLAIAAAMGATVTDIDGKTYVAPHAVGRRPQCAIWSFKHVDHEALLRKARIQYLT